MTDSHHAAQPDGSEPALTDIKRLVSPLKRKADRIRTKASYKDRLTPELLEELEELLDETTPAEAIKREAGYRTVHLVWQIRCLDAVFGRRHWRWLVHHTNNGRTAHAHVLVGNKLAMLALDQATGELQDASDAEILAHWEGPGDVNALVTNDPFKASRTSALRSVLALIGPGGDVTMLPAGSRVPGTQATSTTATTDTAQPPPAASGQDPGTPAGAPATGATQAAPRSAVRLATGVMLREIKDIAHQRRIPASQLAALTRQALDAPESSMSEPEAERALTIVLSDRVVRLPDAAAVRLKALVSSADAHLPVIASQPSAPVDGAGARAGEPSPLAA
jgi:hypothetical protein